MTCVTAIDPAWLAPLARGSPMLALGGAPIASPAPRYDSARDTLLASVRAAYGARGWPLPPCEIPLDALAGAAGAASPCAHRAAREEVAPPRGGGGGGAAADEDDAIAYRWFARLLLEGRVLEPLARLGRDGALSDPPALLTHRKPLAKCARLVGELRRAGVSTAAALRLRLAADPSFLRGALRPWVKADAHNALREAWTACGR